MFKIGCLKIPNKKFLEKLVDGQDVFLTQPRGLAKFES